MGWEITLKLELQSTNFICGSLSLVFCFMPPLKQRRRAGVRGCLYPRSHVCKSSLSPSFLSPDLGSQPTTCVCTGVYREREGQEKSHSHQRHESTLSPGVFNLGSFQSGIDAVQVSQPFVLRARCLTYFQAGMLGHTGIHHICKHSSELRKAFVL